MTFSEFCKTLATPNTCEISNELSYPDEYKSKMDILVNFMKFKMSRLDKIEIPFIQETVNIDTIISKMKDDPMIPTGIPNNLSIELYHKQFNELDNTEQQIIKVLSIYIIIQ